MEAIERPELLEAVEAGDQVGEGDGEGTNRRLGRERSVSEELLGARTHQLGPLIGRPRRVGAAEHEAVLQHHSDGVQAGAAVADVVAVVQGGTRRVEWRHETFERPPGRCRPTWDAPGAVAPQPLWAERFECTPLRRAQPGGAVECREIDAGPCCAT